LTGKAKIQSTIFRPFVIGDSIKCKKASAIIEEINEHVNNWGNFANEVGVKPKRRDEIGKTLLDLR